jgi:hypothetical protein
MSTSDSYSAARLFAFVMTVSGTSTVASAQLATAAKVQLDSLQRFPESAGTLIYQGTVFALSGRAQSLFQYDRRVRTTPSGISVTHATHDPKGTLIIDESAELSSLYELNRFDVANAQTGISGSVIASEGGRHLEYTLNDNGRVTTASERVRDPVVAGPSIHGYILQHWDELAAGRTLPVRLLVLDRLTSYGFALRMTHHAGGTTTFSATPSSVLVRLAIKPLLVTFTDSARTIVRYEGRVPPKLAGGRKLKDLDARVEYRMVTPVYR